ncbi:maleylpyruvate isomerase N-terminal domain-containing protein [Pseudonocardia oroxyli]|uniref:Mycothiol maleylpyruvate isomerase N-terminal domain-containing protein n=1 Tax=Pseudonocardia oroxyli TaxID=366584 RepID=A0A1G7DE19_PSEOR|nr:maleylpyruvate isomerase N-terminal domain-containing protein [Pseudonocardia oroxyli]SDE49787.1 Mycothiol maleylpyruvate isomerase N-terminal domain-containing protein [Pseudonocardia oroxyli]
MPVTALATARSALGAIPVGPADLDRPIPCAEFDVRGLPTHVVGWHHVFAACLAGTAAPGDPTHVLLDPVADLRVSSRLLLDALDTAPDEAELPYRGRTPVPLLVTELVAETVLHGWDLATALAAPFAPFAVDGPVLAEAERGPALLRGEVFAAEAFHPAAGTGVGAGGLPGLVARSGRDPGWRPS